MRTLSLSLCAAALFAACSLSACGGAPPAPAVFVAAPSAQVRRLLAPSGRLRVAVYRGSPTSMLRQPGGDGEMRGLTVVLGRELAARLGVPAEIVVFQRFAEVTAALKAGELDALATNKGILYELADRVPASQVLPGSLGQENLALGVPKGREGALEFLRRFNAGLRAAGRVQRAAAPEPGAGLAKPVHPLHLPLADGRCHGRGHRCRGR